MEGVNLFLLQQLCNLIGNAVGGGLYGDHGIDSNCSWQDTSIANKQTFSFPTLTSLIHNTLFLGCVHSTTSYLMSCKIEGPILILGTKPSYHGNVIQKLLQTFFYETIPTGDTSRHSSNVEGVAHTQGFSSMASQTVHYFSKHNTIKLGEHFLLWKHQILLILEGYDLEGFVFGTTPVPPTYIPGPDGRYVDNLSFLLHKKQDKFLASCLLSIVTDEVLVHLATAKTSCDIWTGIERRFGAKSNVKLSSMRHTLYSLKKGSLTVKEYLTKAKNLSDSLTIAGSVVTEHEHVSIILTGLSLEYESVRVIASTTTMSLELLTEMFLDFASSPVEGWFQSSILQSPDRQSEPSNYVEQVVEAFKILTSDEKMKAILVNIFGGIMKCDMITSAIVNVAKQMRVLFEASFMSTL
ncbi:hypothetical protein Godav_017858 [Gossypium davidsonii]|uniref:ATP-citrate synthase/succinyl-CoA ligase C-terminal domain-containing protein n=1 Tax=Gossypium davidsonii TaxID=34287 RepID=A0A7J8QUL1_GOSDV|nr:hypothetical protein [Gossypium davidsonii]